MGREKCTLLELEPPRYSPIFAHIRPCLLVPSLLGTGSRFNNTLNRLAPRLILGGPTRGKRTAILPFSVKIALVVPIFRLGAGPI
jgi:hypothetical protein